MLYGGQYAEAAAIFSRVAHMFTALKGPGATKGYLSARLMEASALLNNNEDARARRILAEIESTDPTFEPQKVKELQRALR